MFKDWTKFEKILILSSYIIIISVGVIFNSDLLSISCSIVGVTTALLQAKGKKMAQVFGVGITILYSIVSYRNKYYGEVLIYMLILLPMFILGIFSWFRNENKETKTVEVNTIGKTEWCIVSVVFCAVFVGIYHLLKAFDTNELVVSTVSVMASLFAIYLQVRRSKYSFSFYMVNDVILMVLWGIPVFKGTLVLLPVFLDPVINFINDSYGFYNWRKMEKIQKNCNLNDI